MSDPAPEHCARVRRGHGWWFARCGCGYVGPMRFRMAQALRDARYHDWTQAPKDAPLEPWDGPPGG